MESDDLEAGFARHCVFGFCVAGSPQADTPLERRVESALRGRDPVQLVIRQVSVRNQLIISLKSSNCPPDSLCLVVIKTDGTEGELIRRFSSLNAVFTGILCETLHFPYHQHENISKTTYVNK